MAVGDEWRPNNLGLRLVVQENVEPSPVPRSAESEIYGRSLSTIHRLGAFMVDKTGAEVITSPEAAQAKAEFFTSVEEGFGTDMELGGGLEVRDFDTRPIIDGKVRAKDLKTAITGMTQAGLRCAVKTAEGDKRFTPQLVRSEWDHENALLVDAMARGETNYNTRIVISPFPEEAAKASGDEYWRDIGYVPHLKRGFVQVYHIGEDGLVAGSLSFDGSDKAQLRAIFEKHGVHIPESEVTDNWLQYAVTDTLSTAQAKALALEIANQASGDQYTKTTNTVDVTLKYASIMENVFNESYVHVCESLYRGCQTPAVKDLITQLAGKAGHFNGRYSKALYAMRANEDTFSDDDSVVLHELLVYSTIEMMRALHVNPTEAYSVAYLQSLSRDSFQNLLSNFAADGAMNNRTYSACGLKIALGEKSDPSDNPQDAFGGKDRNNDRNKAEADWSGGKKKKGECRVCKIERIDVGRCEICKICVKNKPKMDLVYKQEELARIRARKNIVQLLHDAVNERQSAPTGGGHLSLAA